MIDTHCHLYLEEFKPDINAVIERAQDAGVEKFYLPSIDSSEITNMLGLEAKFPGVCIPMMGLHPCYVKANYREELAVMAEWLGKRPFAAVGEIGLDFYWDKTFEKEQYESFAQQMQWSLDYDLPIVIHTRNAMQETIAAVEPFAARGVRGIFHCFSGNADDAARITAMGFYLGIGGVLTYKKNGLAEAIAGTGLDKLVLETDAPYLTPVPFRGKRNESAYLHYIANRLAELKGVSVEEVNSITTRNAQLIFDGKK